MITKTMLDLCKKWNEIVTVERYKMCPIIHDAFVDGGYPNTATFHFNMREKSETREYNVCCELNARCRTPGRPICEAVWLVLHGESRKLDEEESRCEKQTMVIEGNAIRLQNNDGSIIHMSAGW